MANTTTGRKRRSPRVSWCAPVVVTWEAGGGLKVREKAETEVVNAHGALLRLGTMLPQGRRVDLFDPRSNRSMRARVVCSGPSLGPPVRAGVELNTPSETFWGIYIPV